MFSKCLNKVNKKVIRLKGHKKKRKKRRTTGGSLTPAGPETTWQGSTRISFPGKLKQFSPLHASPRVTYITVWFSFFRVWKYLGCLVPCSVSFSKQGYNAVKLLAVQTVCCCYFSVAVARGVFSPPAMPGLVSATLFTCLSTPGRKTWPAFRASEEVTGRSLFVLGPDCPTSRKKFLQRLPVFESQVYCVGVWYPLYCYYMIFYVSKRTFAKFNSFTQSHLSD